MMVRDFQQVVGGRGAGSMSCLRWRGRLPARIAACVGGGSVYAMGPVHRLSRRRRTFRSWGVLGARGPRPEYPGCPAATLTWVRPVRARLQVLQPPGCAGAAAAARSLFHCLPGTDYLPASGRSTVLLKGHRNASDIPQPTGSVWMRVRGTRAPKASSRHWSRRARSRMRCASTGHGQS